MVNTIHIQSISYLFSKSWYFKYHIIHSCCLKPFCLPPSTDNKKRVGRSCEQREKETHKQRNHQQITREECDGGSGSHTNSTQDLSRNTTKQWRDYSQQTIEQEKAKSLKTWYIWKTQFEHNLTTPAQQITRGGGESDPQSSRWWEGHTKEIPNNNQKPKTYTETK